MLDAERVLLGLLERGAVGDLFGVEDGHGGVLLLAAQAGDLAGSPALICFQGRVAEDRGDDALPAAVLLDVLLELGVLLDLVAERALGEAADRLRPRRILYPARHQ